MTFAVTVKERSENMEKYIIDLNKDWIDGEYLRLPARIAGTLQWIKTKTALIPYTEDSVYAHGYTEAESKYREIRDELEKQAYQRGYKEAYDTAYADAEEVYESGKRAMYQKGLKDAWECARKIASDKVGWNYSIFGQHFTVEILNTHTAQEAIEEIRAHEQAQKEKEEQEEKDSITAEEVMRQYLDTFCTHRIGCTGCPLSTSDFTCGRGHHFLTNKSVSDEEVRRAYAEVLAKMKEGFE